MVHCHIIKRTTERLLVKADFGALTIQPGYGGWQIDIGNKLYTSI